MTNDHSAPWINGKTARQNNDPLLEQIADNMEKRHSLIHSGTPEKQPDDHNDEVWDYEEQ